MNEENFKKGIKELKNIRMTDTEKMNMIEAIFSVPIKSSYINRIPAFALVCSLILLISLTGAVYASGASLPGDMLYPIKTKVVESMLDAVNRAPEKKIVWEEKKVTRRLKEAKKLVEKNELNDELAEKLEREIERGSIAFIEAVNAVASSSATTIPFAFEKAEDLKKEFRRKINESEGGGGDDDKVQSEKIEKIKISVIKILDNEDKSREEKERGKGRRDDRDDEEDRDSDKSGREDD